MGRTRRSDAGETTTILSSSTSSTTRLFHPPHPTLRGPAAGDNSAASDLTFVAFAEALHRELAPSGALETLLVERATLAAWRLHAAVQAETAALQKSSTRRLPRPASDETRRRLDREQLRLERTLDLLQTLQERRQPRWGQPAPLPGASQPVVSPIEDDGDDVPTTPADE